MQIEAVQDANRERVLRARVPEHNSTHTSIQKFTQFGVDLRGSKVGTIELGSLVEIDVQSVRIAVAATLLREVEKSLLRSPEESLGVHAHFMRAMVFLTH
jgi:hypothetical protein